MGRRLKRARYAPGVLLIDGKHVTDVLLDVDAIHEVVSPDDDPLPRTFGLTMTAELPASEFNAFMLSANIWLDNPDPLVDMTFWCAIDSTGPMPVLQVGRHTEVITRCCRGGGSIGRVWRGCMLAPRGEMELEVMGGEGSFP